MPAAGYGMGRPRDGGLSSIGTGSAEHLERSIV